MAHGTCSSTTITFHRRATSTSTHRQAAHNWPSALCPFLGEHICCASVPVCQSRQGMSMQCASEIPLYLRLAATCPLLQGARHQGEDRQLPWLRPCSICATAGPDARGRHSCSCSQRHQQHGPQSAHHLLLLRLVRLARERCTVGGNAPAVTQG